MPGSGDANVVSFGAIIENTSGAVAHDSVVSIWLVDADGERIDGPVEGASAFDQRLTRLLPGERVGVGATQSVSDEVADLDVEIKPATEWLALDREYWLHQPVVARDVTIVRVPGSTTIEFTVDAAYTSEMVPGGFGTRGDYIAIFRDAAGTLVGGVDCCVPLAASDVVSPGRSRGALALHYGVPERADDSHTEVYVLLG